MDTEEPGIIDKYDRAINYLRLHHHEIYSSWWMPWADDHGCLFEFLSPNGSYYPIACGCPTTIKGAGCEAYDPVLTAKIRNDPRVPRSGADITVEHLPVFAEYQREADRLFRCKAHAPEQEATTP